LQKWIAASLRLQKGEPSCPRFIAYDPSNSSSGCRASDDTRSSSPDRVVAIVGMRAPERGDTIIGEKLILSDLYVPLILASALVIRVIKTRAEINEWHKPKRCRFKHHADNVEMISDSWR
jgi:hypothetical protein